MRKEPEEKVKKITFFANKPTLCPICAEKFFREEMLSGGGRLIAGRLTDELRRLYEPSAKYGDINPLIYPVQVCPACYYATFIEDFERFDPKCREKIERDTVQRRQSVNLLFNDIDFRRPRSLKEGVSSCYLAMSCYDYFKKDVMPTVKRAILALRTAWLLSDYHRKAPGENYDYAARIFYRKALFYYRMAIERDQKGIEPLQTKANYGPDTDKNYGYDGVLYLSGILEFKYGSKKDPEKRIKSLEYTKRLFAKIFGLGKKSKSKPSALLDMAREVYNQINQELKSLTGETIETDELTEDA